MRIRQSQVEHPSRVVSTSELDLELGLKEGQSFKYGGVATRYWMSPDETVASLGAAVLQKSLIQSGLEPENLDALIYTGASRAQGIPCTAAVIQEAAGHQEYACFDIDATCLGFLKTLEIANLYLESGTYQRLAIVVSECASRHLNRNNPKTYSLFGDGAVAYILEQDDHQDTENVKLIGSHFATYGELAQECRLLGGFSHLPAYKYNPETHESFLFQMNGRKLYAEAARKLPPHLNRFLDSHQTSIDDIDWVVPHQASRTAMNLLAKRLKIPPHKIIDILETHGNQIAASIPIALHHLLQSQKIKPGQTVLLIGTGAGLGLGIVLLQF